jgi:hypothetical protein
VEAAGAHGTARDAEALVVVENFVMFDNRMVKVENA